MPHLVYIWCYAHLLNLVLLDATSCNISCTPSFANLNGVAVFLKDSYKRMDVWVSTVSQCDKRRLNLIGETRWWAKDAALTKLFGQLEKKQKSLLVTLIVTLKKIQNAPDMKTDTCYSVCYELFKRNSHSHLESKHSHSKFDNTIFVE